MRRKLGKKRTRARRSRGDTVVDFSNVDAVFEWPITLRFVGPFEGIEEVARRPTWTEEAERTTWQVSGDIPQTRRWPLGTFVFHQQAGVPIPGFPQSLWKPAAGAGNVLMLWFEGAGSELADLSKGRSPSGFVVQPAHESPNLIEILERAPWDRLALKPVFVISGRKGGRPSQPCVDYVWQAKDAAAAAWCEIFHAKKTGAGVRHCRLCKRLFLRPHGYKGTWCLGCRQLTWRQRDQIKKAPEAEWAELALKEWVKTLERREGLFWSNAGADENL